MYLLLCEASASFILAHGGESDLSRIVIPVADEHVLRSGE